MLTGHPGRVEGSVNSAGEPGARVALGAELELQFYPRGDGGPLKGSKRENGVIVSHPGRKCLTLSPLFPHHFLARAQWALLGKTEKRLYR